MKDYFEVLNIEDSAGEQAIRDAYKTMLERFPAEQYPEKNIEIEEAFKALSNMAIRSACVEFHRMDPTSKKAYKEAREALEEGQNNKAVKILEKECKNTKYSAHLNYLLGIAYMNLEKPAKAVKVLEPVLHDYPHDMELVLLLTRACLAAKKYDMALLVAEEYYAEYSDNFELLQLIAEGYMLKEEYKGATEVLLKAFENPVFSEKCYSIGAMLSYSLFMEKEFKKCLDMMDRLADFFVEPNEVYESLEVFIDVLDYFIGNHRFTEADRCAGALLKLCPDRKDIAGIKESIEIIQKLEPELMKFEEDDFIPDLLKFYTTNDAFSTNFGVMDDEKKMAYTVLMEYQILNDCSNCLMALRYMKNQYPTLYEFRREFFDGLQDAKERKKLYNKNKALFYQYHEVIESMMDEWDEEDDGGYDDE